MTFPTRYLERRLEVLEQPEELARIYFWEDYKYNMTIQQKPDVKSPLMKLVWLQRSPKTPLALGRLLSKSACKVIFLWDIHSVSTYKGHFWETSQISGENKRQTSPW